MTDRQRSILVSLSHGDLVQGHLLANSSYVIRGLMNAGSIRGEGQTARLLEDYYSITPKGKEMLRDSE